MYIMFGRRRDGKQIKVDGMTRLMPQLMRTRNGATNLFKLRMPAEKIDNYIADKAKEGVHYTYRDVIVALLVRLFKVRPRLNQFIVGGRFYQRNHIDLTMMVHKSLRSGEQESVCKVRFTGYESIAEVKQKLDSGIAHALDDSNESDGVVRVFEALPFFLFKFFARIFRLLDHWGLLSDKFLFENSPFHCSIFFSDMKSIKMDYVYHHLYNFGNCGFFLSLGKEHLEAGFDEKGNVVQKKMIDCGVSEDERFIDGLYFNRMIKSMQRIVDDFTVLERPLREDEIFPLKSWKEVKRERKTKAKAKKAAAKKKEKEERAQKRAKKAS